MEVPGHVRRRLLSTCSPHKAAAKDLASTLQQADSLRGWIHDLVVSRRRAEEQDQLTNGQRGHTWRFTVIVSITLRDSLHKLAPLSSHLEYEESFCGWDELLFAVMTVQHFILHPAVGDLFCSDQRSSELNFIVQRCSVASGSSIWRRYGTYLEGWIYFASSTLTSHT